MAYTVNENCCQWIFIKTKGIKQYKCNNVRLEWSYVLYREHLSISNSWQVWSLFLTTQRHPIVWDFYNFLVVPRANAPLANMIRLKHWSPKLGCFWIKLDCLNSKGLKFKFKSNLHLNQPVPPKFDCNLYTNLPTKSTNLICTRSKWWYSLSPATHSVVYTYNEYHTKTEASIA